MKKIMALMIGLLFSCAAFASGEVLKINTTGKQYCSGLPATSFNPKNDIDLWLSIDSATSATIFADELLTMPVVTLSLRTEPLSLTKISFNAFTGSSSYHISAYGTFYLDKLGVIKSLKGALIRRGVINSCYSNMTISGKRVI